MNLEFYQVKQVKISDSVHGKRFIMIETQNGDYRIDLDGMIDGADSNRAIPIRRERKK